MSDQTANPDGVEDAPKKKGLIAPLLIGLVLASAGGTGGFFAGSTGLIGGSQSASTEQTPGSVRETVFVDIEPLVVSIVRPDRVAQLRMLLSVEVDGPYASEVEALMPRLKDVLNSYLRAIDTTDFEGAGALVRLRAQMLRRIRIVVGHDAVHDLLVQEFVVN